MDGDNQLEKQQYAEEVGIFLEQSGMPRMAGRVLGWLTVAEPPHQTMTNLTEALQASKGSISTMTRLLIQIGLIERISLPGQRRDYFRIKADTWDQKLKESLEQTTAFRQLSERGLELVKDAENSNRRWLKEMRDMYIFFEQELPAMLERWEKKSGKKHTR
ncbi:MAG: MarR family transcriptional regulator [Dehalococcoidales bacterium]